MAKVLAKYFAKVEGSENYVPVEILQAERSGIFKVSVDGKEYDVDYSETAQSMHSFIIDHQSYGVELSKKGDVYDIHRADDFFKVEILDEMKKFMKERITRELEGRQVIDTQMPGLIMKVFVEKGQEVQAGDPLMILVAMKMENEIKASKNGIVQEIFVEEGQTVGAGDKLVIVE